MMATPILISASSNNLTKPMTQQVPSVSVNYAANGTSTKSNELGMRTMQERAYEKRGEQ